MSHSHCLETCIKSIHLKLYLIISLWWALWKLNFLKQTTELSGWEGWHTYFLSLVNQSNIDEIVGVAFIWKRSNSTFLQMCFTALLHSMDGSLKKKCLKCILPFVSHTWTNRCLHESKLGCALSMRETALLSFLLVKTTLSNCGCLQTHVYES